MTEHISSSLADYASDAILTEGNFETEEQSVAHLMPILAASEYFTVYREVDGWYFGGSPFGDKGKARIDCILSPKRPLIELGWQMGFIGVEIKKSGHAAGPLICQMCDYSKAIFTLPDRAGCVRVCLSAVTCFPAFRSKGSIASVMAANRLGFVHPGNQGELRLMVNNTNIFTCRNGVATVKAVDCGKKNGSR